MVIKIPNRLVVVFVIVNNHLVFALQCIKKTLKMLNFYTLNTKHQVNTKYSLHLFNTNYTILNTIYIKVYVLNNNIYDLAKKLERSPISPDKDPALK